MEHQDQLQEDILQGVVQEIEGQLQELFQVVLVVEVMEYLLQVELLELQIQVVEQELLFVEMVHLVDQE
jgi:hypothetical protein